MSEARMDTSSIKNNAANSMDDVVDRSKAAVSEMKKQGGKLANQAADKMDDSIEYLGGHADAVRSAVKDYVNAKPGTSIAIGLAALYILRRITRR